jgi:hypothetical protein
MRENRTLRRVLSIILAGALAIPAVLVVSASPARAEEAASPDPDGVRRRLMWGAVALSGASLLGGFYWHHRESGFIDQFNRHTVSPSDPSVPPDGRCAVNAANHGGARCAALLSSSERAHTAYQVSLVVAGAAAVTALTLKLLEPDAPKKSPEVEGWELACAPILGAGGTCTLRF